MADDSDVIRGIAQRLEAAFELTKGCRSALLLAADCEDPIQAFRGASTCGADIELAAYVEALIQLRPLTDHEDGNGAITASRAERIYKDAKHRLERLNTQLDTSSQKYITPPPQVGVRHSIWTISGGLPTLGRRHR
ncbi:MAG TPA: hypothetical protein VFT59_01675 [Candidatus Saccharimonadales bacterium]|nr:hypothetical protein [Candidatus Saccharimonadales bacterium]